ncbi:MAG TPA: biotin--[acetyl-CoA-carboxylase] ligase [Thermodesulfovibrionales bacterium]|nr:biotin--[acetyl-CoA-carboxylase] ligase [Thermodesulfovibrionales bacterium]
MDELKSLIKGKIGRNLISLDTVDSTNTYAMELAEKGAAHGTVVIAEYQTKGRGRIGRTWVSPPGGNIYMSVIIRPAIKLKDATLLTIMAGVACCLALKDIAGLPVDLKWPNDLMVSNKKIGGILTEVKSNAGKIFFAAMGIGINVNVPMEAFSQDVRGIATSIGNETAREHSLEPLIAGILNEIDTWTDILAEDGGESVVNEWRRSTTMLGKSVRVSLGDESLTGIAEDVDEQGMLILRLPSGISRKINAGDLTVLR